MDLGEHIFVFWRYQLQCISCGDLRWILLAGHESDQERAGAGRAIEMGRERKPTDTSDLYYRCI